MSIATLPPVPATTTGDRRLQVVVTAGAVVLGAPLLAHLAATGRPLFAVPLLLALPAVVALSRKPLLAITIWLLVNQLVVNGSGGPERQVYWAVHRALPLTVLALIAVVQVIGPHRRELSRLGAPELAMGGYVLVTVASIWYNSATPAATSVHFLDRVALPMALYLVIRLVRLTRQDLLVIVTALGVVVITQTVIGLLSWSAPGLLPPAWLNREGLRTVGSLDHPNVYGTTMITGALLLLHTGANAARRPALQLAALATGLLGLFMTFMTFGRANWVAAIPAVIGFVVLHRRFARRMVAVGTIGLALLIGNGALTTQAEHAAQRFSSAQSQESALSRLPVIYASIKMFEARPLTGWGYGDFDRYDEQFKARVGNLVYPDKEHASHNLYLTILAEQGLIGFVLYVFPALWWFRLTLKRWHTLPAWGLVSRQLVGVLWLAALSHVIVANFANVRIVYGLGLWWILLGLIAALVTSADDQHATRGRSPHSAGRPLPDHFTPAGPPSLRPLP